jgi:hypothetical protein
MVFALSCLYAHTESETSYTWKLDLDVGKVMPGHFLSPLAANAASNSDLNNGSQETSLNDFEDSQELMHIALEGVGSEAEAVGVEVGVLDVLGDLVSQQ